MTEPSIIKFIDKELEKIFNEMSNEDPIKKALIRAFQEIKKDYQAGEYIPKKDIPESYLKRHGINNIRVYDLPFA